MNDETRDKLSEILTRGIDRIINDRIEVIAENDDLHADLARCDEIIARLKDRSALAVDTLIKESGFGTLCPICCIPNDDGDELIHQQGCPVALFRALMKELE